VNDETIDHLRAAEGNRQFALSLLAPMATQIPARCWEWVGVAAFYSAVHYVNAYLWEHHGVAPSNHSERRRWLAADRTMARVTDQYDLLQVYGFEARYEPTFAASEHMAKDAVDIDLRAIEAAVLRALGLDVPGWRLPGPA
jgi:hypothetical protein